MPAPPISGLDLTPPLAAAVVLACIAVALYALRAHQRRQHRSERRRVGEFMRRCEGFLRGQNSAAALRDTLDHTSEGEFWTALERLSMHWSRAEWRALSAALERNSFTNDERRALRHDSPWRQVLAARRLTLLRSKANRRALRRGLVRGDEMGAFACAQALARYRDIAALRWLLEHPGRIERRAPLAQVALLGGFGRHGHGVLASALERGVEAPCVERALIEVLGTLGERTAQSAIQRRLSSPSFELRVVAARALGRLRATDAAAALLAALQDEAWQVRAQAARALGEAGVQSAVLALPAKLSDPAWWVRRHAAYALAELGPAGHAALREILEHSPDRYSRDMAGEVLDGGPKLGAA